MLTDARLRRRTRKTRSSRSIGSRTISRSNLWVRTNLAFPNGQSQPRDVVHREACPNDPGDDVQGAQECRRPVRETPDQDHIDQEDDGEQVERTLCTLDPTTTGRCQDFWLDGSHMRIVRRCASTRSGAAPKLEGCACRPSPKDEAPKPLRASDTSGHGALSAEPNGIGKADALRLGCRLIWDAHFLQKFGLEGPAKYSVLLSAEPSRERPGAVAD